MISVVIPTFNAAPTLVHTLAALVPAVVEGIVQEAIVADGGSTDDTLVIADAAGTHLVQAPRGRGTQLDAGAGMARGDWLLFLHADTVLEPGWAEEAQSFIDRVEAGRRRQAALVAVEGVGETRAKQLLGFFHRLEAAAHEWEPVLD